MKPVTPKEAEKRTVSALPDYFIEALNNDIVQEYDDGRAVVTLNKMKSFVDTLGCWAFNADTVIHKFINPGRAPVGPAMLITS